MYKSFVFLLFVIYVSCETKGGFFDEMPSNYAVDSLEAFKDVIGNLRTFKKNGGDILHVISDDCPLVSICGYLIYKNDSIFYSSEENGDLKFFLNLNARRFQKHTIEYSEDRIDEVTYMGKIQDKSSADSVFLFMLSPVVRRTPIDATYLKFICLKRGAITHITFSNSSGDYTIALSRKATLVNKNVY